MPKTWLIPVGGAVLAPLVTWWPMLAYRFPALGLPQYPAAVGIDFWGAQTFWCAGLVLLAVLIGQEDRWLGGAVALAGLTVFWRGAKMDPTHSVLFALGAAMVYAMRRTPVAWHPRIKSVLVALGVFQLLYVMQQLLGYDLLWGPLFGGQLVANVQTLGTLGTVDAAGAYLAITAPLMPWWALPVVFFAVWKTHAVSATLALAAGLAMRYRHSLALYPLAAVALVLAYFSAFAKSVNPIAAHLHGRGAIWAFAGADWLRFDPVTGYGLGGWAARVPALQMQAQFAPTGELWREAHNEPLQWICEAGVIGLILLSLWLFTHRAMFTHPVWGGSLTALGVNSLTFFPLHVVPIALLAVILVGLATAPADRQSSAAANSLADIESGAGITSGWGAET